MRIQIIAAFAAISVATAFAQTTPQRPTDPAPQLTAPIEQREAWCARYTPWVVAHMPQEAAQATEARTTHRDEVELNSCTLDPQEYERVTIAEVSRTMRERRAEG